MDRERDMARDEVFSTLGVGGPPAGAGDARAEDMSDGAGEASSRLFFRLLVSAGTMYTQDCELVVMAWISCRDSPCSCSGARKAMTMLRDSSASEAMLFPQRTGNISIVFQAPREYELRTSSPARFALVSYQVLPAIYLSTPSSHRRDHRPHHLLPFAAEQLKRLQNHPIAFGAHSPDLSIRSL